MLWQVFLLAIAPVFELRGAIPLGIGLGMNTFAVVSVAIIGNILIMPIVYLFLNYIHKHLMELSWYSKLFNKIIERNRHKIENKIGTKAEFLGILLFTAIPFPMTGAYTASLLSWFFGLDTRKAFLAITLGIFISAALVTLASLGVLSVF